MSHLCYPTHPGLWWGGKGAMERAIVHFLFHSFNDDAFWSCLPLFSFFFIPLLGPHGEEGGRTGDIFKRQVIKWVGKEKSCGANGALVQTIPPPLAGRDGGLPFTDLPLPHFLSSHWSAQHTTSQNMDSGSQLGSWTNRCNTERT